MMEINGVQFTRRHAGMGRYDILAADDAGKRHIGTAAKNKKGRWWWRSPDAKSESDYATLDEAQESCAVAWNRRASA